MNYNYRIEAPSFKNFAGIPSRMLLVLLVLVTICLDPVYGITSCLDKPCSCCKRGKCEDPSLHRYPCDGCITGFTGPSCLEPCPTNCENCSQLFFEYDSEKVCFQCKAGFYNGHYGDIESYPLQQDCALACKTGCDLCTSYNVCSKCKSGYFLSKDKECNECRPNCEHCQSEFGCLACQNGYGWFNEECQPCKPSCKLCKSSGECLECYIGFYEYDNDCVGCPLGCAKCSGPEVCNDCQEGYYLLHGQCIKCMENCEACTLNSMSQFTCKTCKNGFFLSNNICLECEIGCISCSSKSNCLTCVSNYKLHDGKCYSCSLPCTSCSSDNYCTACESKNYLMDGNCFACQENCATCSSENLCITCEQGYFGSDCSRACPENCANNVCNQSTGECIACKNGYFFDKSSCIICPHHCTVCTSITTCLACASGYKGITCEEKCNQCLPGTACDKSTGYCLQTCADGLSGKRCNLFCDSFCLSCDRANPSKCVKCAFYRYGAACRNNCSEKCASNTCDDNDGACTYGCFTGFWGSRCEHQCPVNCNSKKCEMSNGTCSAGNIDDIKDDTGGETNASKVTIFHIIVIAISVLTLVSAFLMFIFRKRIKTCLCRTTSPYRRQTEDPEKPSPGEDEDLLTAQNDTNHEASYEWKIPMNMGNPVMTFVKNGYEENFTDQSLERGSLDTYIKDVKSVTKTTAGVIKQPDDETETWHETYETFPLGTVENELKEEAGKTPSSTESQESEDPLNMKQSVKALVKAYGENIKDQSLERGSSRETYKKDVKTVIEMTEDVIKQQGCGAETQPREGKHAANYKDIDNLNTQSKPSGRDPQVGSETGELPDETNSKSKPSIKGQSSQYATKEDCAETQSELSKSDKDEERSKKDSKELRNSLDMRQSVKALVKEYGENVKNKSLERGSSRESYKKDVKTVIEMTGDVVKEQGDEAETYYDATDRFSSEDSENKSKEGADNALSSARKQPSSQDQHGEHKTGEDDFDSQLNESRNPLDMRQSVKTLVKEHGENVKDKSLERGSSRKSYKKDVKTVTEMTGDVVKHHSGEAETESRNPLDMRQSVKTLVKEYGENVKDKSLERGSSRESYKKDVKTVTEMTGDVVKQHGGEDSRNPLDMRQSVKTLVKKYGENVKDKSLERESSRESYKEDVKTVTEMTGDVVKQHGGEAETGSKLDNDEKNSKKDLKTSSQGQPGENKTGEDDLSLQPDDSLKLCMMLMVFKRLWRRVNLNRFECQVPIVLLMQ